MVIKYWNTVNLLFKIYEEMLIKGNLLFYLNKATI